MKRAVLTIIVLLSITGITYAREFRLPSSDHVQIESTPSSSDWDFGNSIAFVVRVDVTKPTGTISINSGAAYTKSTAVTLNLSANDGAGSGVAEASFSHNGTAWFAWAPYTPTKSWTLPAGDGTKRVWARFKDAAGNISTAVSDTILLDTKAPSASLTAPWLSTVVTKTTKFKIKWSGSDPAPASGIASYDTQYKVYGGSWRNWKTNTTAKAAYFKAKPGKTYYFRARAKDNAGNIGKYSKAKRTIVPFDNNSLIRKHVGFGRTYKNNKSRYYRNTIRYSTRAGDSIAYRFTGRGVYLISTKSKTRSKAKIYMDGKYIKTINTWSRRSKYRQIVFKKSWSRRKTHTIKIINVGNKKRLDIDALAVRK